MGYDFVGLLGPGGACADGGREGLFAGHFDDFAAIAGALFAEVISLMYA